MKKYVKPTFQLVELRPEEQLALGNCHTTWLTPGQGFGSNCNQGKCTSTHS